MMTTTRAGIYFTKHLEGDEEVLAVVRATVLASSGWILAACVLILAAFFLLFPLFRAGVWGTIAFTLLLGAGVFVAIRVGILWYYNVFLITNRRIIDFDQHGLFTRTVSECSHDKVQDVRYTVRGPLQTLFGFGDIIVQTASADTHLEIENVREPKELVSLITELQRESSTREGPLSAEELIRLIERIRATDRATYNRLLGSIVRDDEQEEDERPLRRS